MQTRAGHPAQIHLVISEARAQTAHGERRTQDHWIAELLCGDKTFVHRVRDVATCRLTATSRDGALEQLAVLAELDRLDAGTDERAAVLLQDARLVQGNSRVERRLAAQGRQDRVGAFS